jgi:hypothetical protein
VTQSKKSPVKAFITGDADSTLRVFKERQPITADRTSKAPAATCLSDDVVEVNGIEPMTPCLQSRCSPS